jgi:hypothetical protein
MEKKDWPEIQSGLLQSNRDGLYVIWLVNDEGGYEQTIDHDFLKEYFGVENQSKERSLYGRSRPKFRPLRQKDRD